MGSLGLCLSVPASHVPSSPCGDHIGDAEPAAWAECRKPRALALAQGSGAEEIGLDGTGVGWQPGEGSIWPMPIFPKRARLQALEPSQD